MTGPPSLLRFRVRTLLAAGGLLAALLLTAVLTPQILAQRARLEALRDHVGQLARLAAVQIDGDLHRQLSAGDADEATRRQALAPLLRLHRALPEAFYVYTMAVLADGTPCFILDTAQDPVFARSRGLQASQYMETFEVLDEYADDWLQVLQSGRTYVNPGFERDEYGDFLSGNAPILDGAGQVAGFAAVDLDLGEYLRQEKRFHRIEAISILAAVLLGLLLGYVYARYRYAQEIELQRHYRWSMQDSLTGLPNRRGARAAAEALWREPGARIHAVLLVDIDHFKGINDTHGHLAGDEILKALARELRASVRPGDIAARLGGDEFMIFARDCDRHGAELIVERLLSAVRKVTSPAPFSISVGISIATAGAQDGLVVLFREADQALYKAKDKGRDGYAVFAVA